MEETPIKAWIKDNNCAHFAKLTESKISSSIFIFIPLVVLLVVVDENFFCYSSSFKDDQKLTIHTHLHPHTQMLPLREYNNERKKDWKACASSFNNGIELLCWFIGLRRKQFRFYNSLSLELTHHMIIQPKKWISI